MWRSYVIGNVVGTVGTTHAKLCVVSCGSLARGRRPNGSGPVAPKARGLAEAEGGGCGGVVSSEVSLVPSVPVPSCVSSAVVASFVAAGPMAVALAPSKARRLAEAEGGVCGGVMLSEVPSAPSAPVPSCVSSPVQHAIK